MATGAGLGNLIPVAMTLVGVVSMLRARRNRRTGRVETDDTSERRQASAAEMERRMASYLAGRDIGRADADPEPTTQENGR
ncbi:MAG: hypothetical protein U1E06_20255 [Tabrizicola sp.]|uniref:hypothetical protein n=1 Tax=Tabrizicola sp. TaxID=2005166 RepID=UPI0027367627|nr:hypothetical protein [Tabrizicola sp.]MDP3263404.1 hypothetical protein [Tabrizicola sp.]MDP3646761.1 hypothetical protein [Paracoccaceae bacterium]MDZ4069135.1 hypothetical protein [Tabrizicola sp.]